jgi:hypothetical protein
MIGVRRRASLIFNECPACQDDRYEFTRMKTMRALILNVAVFIQVLAAAFSSGR